MDQLILEFITDLRSPVLTVLSLAISGMAEFALIWIVLLAVLIWRDHRRGWLVAKLATFALSLEFLIVNGYFGWLLERPRPYEALPGLGQFGLAWSNNSFPSGHVASSVAILWVVAVFYPRFRWWAVGLSLAMMFSRVYNGMHWPTDVAIGAVVGVIAGWLAIYIYHTLPAAHAQAKGHRA